MVTHLFPLNVPDVNSFELDPCQPYSEKSMIVLRFLCNLIYFCAVAALCAKPRQGGEDIIGRLNYPGRGEFWLPDRNR
jgi:hypothetical protein